MASVPLSSSSFSSHSQLSPRPIFLAKPPLFSSTRLKPVSCNANDESSGKVDRRNLLLGVGGLYGATNLISGGDAVAAPIAAPNLAKCSIGTNLNSDKPLDENCCPPMLGKIFDYQLPPVGKLRIRPTAHLVSREYVAKYERAVQLMKELPANDPRNFMQQANVHCAYCNLTYEQTGDPTKKLQVHNSWLFFPFHRWYLYFYERILGKLINDPTFALPYWNWDSPPGMPIPAMFTQNPRSPLYDPRRNQLNLPPARVDLTFHNNPADPAIIVPNNLREMYHEMTRANYLEDFYGAKYVVGCNPEPGAGTVERGSHTAVHAWVGDPRSKSGEDLGNFYSAARDPLFYSHHANVDRLWTIWCQLRGNRPCFFREPDWLDANFLFYDENSRLVRVRVRDSLNELNMGFVSQKAELPWLKNRPPRRMRRPNGPGPGPGPGRGPPGPGPGRGPPGPPGPGRGPPGPPGRGPPGPPGPGRGPPGPGRGPPPPGPGRGPPPPGPGRGPPVPGRGPPAGNPPKVFFPVKLNGVVRVMVNRPKDNPNKQEELLVIEGIEVDSSRFARFDVFVNDEDDMPNEVIDKASYAGCYSQLPHRSSSRVRSKIRLGLGELLQDLDVEGDEQLLVSLVPRARGEDISIGGVKIIISSETELTPCD